MNTTTERTADEMSIKEIQAVFAPSFAGSAYAMLKEMSPHVHIGEATHMRLLPDTEEEFLQFLKDNEDKNLYFTEGASESVKHKSRVGDGDITHKSHFCIDIDYRSSHPDCEDEEILSTARRIVPLIDEHVMFKHWRMIVFSGNGIHIHYTGSPTVIKSKNAWANGLRYSLEEFKRATGLADEVDMTCVNTSRLFRIPGTYNVKKQKKFVSILYENYEQY
jgi:hypothetical protein